MTILLILICLSLIILIHECGHFFAAKIFRVRVDEFGLGFPPRIIGKKIGETLYSLNLLPFGGFVKIFGEDQKETKEENINHDNSKRNFAFQSISRRMVIILAGVTMNIVLGWVMLSIVFMSGSPEHLLITVVSKNSPAEIQGLQSGDVLLRAQGGDQILSDPIRADEFVAFTKKEGHAPITLTLMRGKETLIKTIQGRSNPPEGQGVLGIGIESIGFPPQSFFASIVKGMTRTVELLWLILVGLFNFFTKLFVSPEVLESVAGPVGIFTIATHASALGIVYLIELMAIISLNLAVLNCIPFPVLDGGRALFLVIEKIKGSPIPQKVERIANISGFALLLIIMGIVTVQDIVKLFR